MTQPNSFGLVYAVTVLRELADHLDAANAYPYDADTLSEAADLIDDFMKENDITLLEIDNDDQTTDIETEEDPPTTDFPYRSGGPNYE